MPITRRHVSITTACLVTVALAHPRIATAQTGAQLASRRVMLEQAEEADRAGDHARALDLAQRAAAIHMTPSVRYFIATQESALGRFAAALGDADQCVIDAQNDPSIQSRDAILASCRSMVSSLRQRIGQIVVQAPSPAPSGLRVTVAGESLAPAMFGVSTVVTPGDVTVVAEAPGYQTFRATLHVNAGSSGNVQLVLRPEAAGTATSSADRGTRASAAAPTASESSRITPARVAAGAAAIVGLAALGVGAGLYVDTSATYARCMTQFCPYVSQPRGEDMAAVVMMWAGGAVAVLGAAAFLFLPTPREQHPSAHARIWIDPRGMAGIVGVF